MSDYSPLWQFLQNRTTTPFEKAYNPAAQYVPNQANSPLLKMLNSQAQSSTPFEIGSFPGINVPRDPQPAAAPQNFGLKDLGNLVAPNTTRLVNAIGQMGGIGGKGGGGG